MKKMTALVASLALVMMSTTQAFAITDTGNVEDIPVGQSGINIEMQGQLAPSIISLTMPTSIYFDMNSQIEGENKVLSPEIVIDNNSYSDVTISVMNTQIDLTKLDGVEWGNGGVTNDNEIAVGLSVTPTAPTTLESAQWLRQNDMNNPMVLCLIDSFMDESFYVVGNLGSGVNSSSTFTVSTTFMASVK